MVATCIKIEKKIKKVSIGALDTKIWFLNRDIQPENLTPDFKEEFSNYIELWSFIESVSGIEIFDSSNTVRSISNYIYIRFVANITSEKWILVPAQYPTSATVDTYYDIVRVENLNNENRYYRLYCNIRGDTSFAANEI